MCRKQNVSKRRQILIYRSILDWYMINMLRNEQQIKWTELK